SLSISGGSFTYKGDGSHVSTTSVNAGVLELDGGHLNDVTVGGGAFSMRNNAGIAQLNVDRGQIGTSDGRVGTGGKAEHLPSDITWLTPISGPGPGEFQVVRIDKCTSWNGNFSVTLRNGYVPAAGTRFKVIECVSNNGGGEFNGLKEGATVTA